MRISLQQKRTFVLLIILTIASLPLNGFAQKPATAQSQAQPETQAPSVLPASNLELVATSDYQWTGVAVSQTGRIFVNFPRWSDDVPISVAELVDGKATPYPNAEINMWHNGLDPTTHFVCVQAVYIDGKNNLWILDPASPQFKGVIPDGPKLVKVDLKTNTITKTYPFSADVAPEKSYLNDVRIDTAHDFAYMTDSGLGAIIALNLKTGKAKRFLTKSPTTKSEDVVLTINGNKWLQNGNAPQVHSDGIAYDPKEDILYFQALTGRTMYAIPASVLRDFSLSPETVEKHVRAVGETGAADGLLFGPDNKVYISALEHNAVMRTTPSGQVEIVVSSPEINWVDSFSLGPDNELYFTDSFINMMPSYKGPYNLYRIKLP